MQKEIVRGEVERAEPMLRADSSSVLRPKVREVANETGRAADARAARAAAALPCLNTINCNEGKDKSHNRLSAGHRKTAFALKVNVLWLIEKHGLENIGFLT